MDLVLCSVPKSNPESPLLGPSTVVAAAKSLGWGAKVLDWNIELFHQLKREGLSTGDWIRLDREFKSESAFLDFLQKPTVAHLIEKWIDQICQLKPRYVGFTAFSDSNTLMIAHLAEQLRRERPDLRLILGGPGSYFCGKNLLEKQLVDYVVLGYGESIIGGILDGSVAKGHHVVHSLEVTAGSSRFCQPDYSDLDLGSYTSQTLHISTSRGCTQNCQFCIVSSLWGSYQLRTPDSVAKEVRNGIDLYQIRHFCFTDSTFNGSLDHQRAICRSLIDLNSEIYWQAFVKIPKAGESHEEDFQLLRRAGCYLLKVGIESGSERVRREMGKRFSDSDLRIFLTHLRSSSIKADLFFMVGYPTETDADFEQTLTLIKELRQFQDVVDYIRIAPTDVTSETPLHKNRTRYGIESDGCTGWKNSNSSPEIRLKRYLELRDSVLESGFKIRPLEDVRMSQVVHDRLQHL
ncbi:MAG: radical SAM protein [Bdellovibrionales bacterium]|nr:radical SAM protein [Bdellovibrionales bacterium]